MRNWRAKAILLLTLCVVTLSAQDQPRTKPAAVLPSRSLTITVSRGTLVQFEDQATRVSVSDPATADAVVVSPHDVVLNGKMPGTTTIMIWHGDSVSPFQVTVQADLAEIQRQLLAVFPNEHIEVSSARDSILLTGVVADEEIAKQAAALASIHAKSVVNLLQVPAADNRQVMLQVKFATIDRTNLSQFGLNIFSTSSKITGTTTTQQFQFPRIGQLQVSPGPDGAPKLDNLQVSVTDLLNLFAFRPDINVGATLRALQNNNLLEILAEPNLITVSGREASFLAGGEFPFPVISNTGSSGNNAPTVTVQFREFGVRLFFTPTVERNGLIHLKVRPEVSSLDYANALTIQGFLIPAISTRKAETEVDLREGESFAIAGLIDNRAAQVLNKVPGLGDLPVFGHLFRSHSTQKSNSELLVLVTPVFVKPHPVGETVPLPAFEEGFLKTKEGATFVGPRGAQ